MDLIKRKRQVYLESQTKGFLVEDVTRNLFRNAKAFNTKDRPKAFDPMSFSPGKMEVEAASELVAYFNRISAEFHPLEPADILRTQHGSLPIFPPYHLEGRIRGFKKPKLMAMGEIFPALCLIDRYCPLLAIPLTSTYNEITTTNIWLASWKQEYVTILPKYRIPVALGDLCNISSTMLPSEVYKSFILNWLSTKVKCKPNQYGDMN